jgi:POT family proton-dependent oligopeptide transporter
MTDLAAASPSPDPMDKQWFGHPRGLATLFFTEMWERLSYYGMRAILVLFMTAPLTQANPGLGYGVERSAAIYGLYTGLVYLLSLPGGWVADKLWGQRKAVFVGGCIIALGHFSMAAPLIGLPDELFFFLGLLLIVIGTGLLKPNVSTMVGALYPSAEEHEGDDPASREAARQAGARRDAGFSIFYMGINVGAVLGPFICGTLGETVNWHWGFSAAGFGMLLGLIQYRLGGKYLGTAGLLDTGEDAAALRRRGRKFYLAACTAGLLVALFAWLGAHDIVHITLTEVAESLIYVIVVLAVLYFVYLFIAGGYGAKEKRRLVVIFWLFILAAIFWSGFEQAGSSLNLFARDLTDRVMFGKEMPTSWLQNVNPFFIIIFAPVFGWLWTMLARRHKNPSIPVKFGLGLLGLAAGFFVLAWGASYATVENPVTPAWLVVTYFLHTCGELALSPVGLSSFTKLAPRDRVGQMMGIWFVAAALGNVFAGLVAGRLENMAPQQLFWNVALFIGGAGVVALILAPIARRIMGHVD